MANQWVPPFANVRLKEISRGKAAVHHHLSFHHAILWVPPVRVRVTVRVKVRVRVRVRVKVKVKVRVRVG